MDRRPSDYKYNLVDTVHAHNIIFDTREVFLHGEDVNGEDGGMDFRVAAKFLKNLRILENYNKDPIIVHQHNIGGFTESGMVVYDSILHSPCHITIIMHGSACSMGSIIPQASDLRLIMPNCRFLVHGGNIDISGTYKQIQSMSEIEQSLFDTIINIYSNVAVNGIFFTEQNASIQTVKRYILNKIDKKEDWWLLSHDVVSFGFADAIFGSKSYENLDVIRKRIKNG